LENDVVCPTAGVSPQDNHTNGTNKVELQKAAHRETNMWAARLQDTKESGILFIIKKNGRVVREAWTRFPCYTLRPGQASTAISIEN